jgi:hypothetical protein
MESKNKFYIVHPAYDIVDNKLFLGFSEKKLNSETKKWENKNLHIVVQIDESGKPNINILTESQFKVNGTEYIFEPNSVGKERHLPRLDYRWSSELLEEVENDFEINPSEVFETQLINLNRFVKFEKDEDGEIIVSWIIATYFHQIFYAFPFLHLKAMKGSGKTTLLDFIRLTSFNAVKAQATFSSMRDNIDSQRTTFLIDQADKVLGTKEIGEIANMVTDSYKKSGSKIIKSVEVNKKFVNAEYDVYSPKGFASIKEINYDLKDRCIQIPLYKSKQAVEFLKEESPLWLKLRDGNYKLLISSFHKVKEIYEELQTKYLGSSEIIGRNLELWLPIETIMILCGRSEKIIEAVKQNYLNRNKNTESTLTPSEWAVIDRILYLLGNDEIFWLSTKNIAEGIEFENFNDIENSKIELKSQYVGNIIKRLNLFTDQSHGRKGNSWQFMKSKVEKIRDAYSGEKTSPPLTTEKDLIF